MRRFQAHAGGTRVRISADERSLLTQLARDYRGLLLGGASDITRRLYPHAYPDDPDANDAFIATSHDALLAKRLDNLDLFESTIDLEQLRPEQVEIWMGIINDMRLVIGTALNVSEDDDLTELDDEDASSRMVYEHLGFLVSELLEVLGG